MQLILSVILGHGCYPSSTALSGRSYALVFRDQPGHIIYQTRTHTMAKTLVPVRCCHGCVFSQITSSLLMLLPIDLRFGLPGGRNADQVNPFIGRSTPTPLLLLLQNFTIGIQHFFVDADLFAFGGSWVL